MENILYNKIKKSVLNKGYKFFEGGDFDINLVLERTSNNFSDKFDDNTYICYKENGIEKCLNLKVTTKAGYKKAAEKPITYEGITGTAVIIPNQYRGVWQYLPNGIASKKYPFNTTYLMQIKGMDYWRDSDGDKTIDEMQIQKNKIFGTQFHVMSYEGKEYGNVSNWSLGCCGCQWTDYWKIIEIIKKGVSIWGDKLTLTLLESKDIL